MALVQEEENKILAICKTSDSTGTRTKPDKLKKILDDRSLADKIIAVGFDTASTNTGVHRIALTILQQLLSQQILWMACRHHNILEAELVIVIGSASKQLFGDTTSLKVTLSKIMKIPSLQYPYLRQERPMRNYSSLISSANSTISPGDY